MGLGLPLVAASVLIAGCVTGGDSYFTATRSKANVYVAPVPAAIRKVAIMPFKAPTELISSSVSDLFVTEMLRTRRYDLVERSQMAKVLSESELALAGLSAEKAVQVGNMLGAEGVIIGTVDEYGTVARRGRTFPVVGISVRLIDCKSGKVMWSADIGSKSSDPAVTLAEHSRAAVHDMTAGLYQRWNVQRRVYAPEPEEGGEVAEEEAVAMTGEDPPAAPSGFELSDMGLREVSITWPRPTDRPSRYRIERATSADGPFEEIAQLSPWACQYMDRGARGEPLKDGTTYYYRLIAVAGGGVQSAPSEVRESMTAPAPEPPAGVKAVPNGSRAVQVTWERSPSEAVEKYVVERAGPGHTTRFAARSDTAETSYREGGTPQSDLADSSKYYYRVIAVNRVGAQSAPSKPAAVVTAPPPAPVKGVAAEDDWVRCVPLTWQASPEEDVVCYDVYRSEAPTGEFVRVGSVKGRDSTSDVDGGPEPGELGDATTYYYKLRAVNAVNAESADSAVVSASTRGPPPVVQGARSDGNRPREVRVEWATSPDEKVAGYAVGRADEDSDDFVEVATVSGREATEYLDRGGARRPTDLGLLRDGTVYRHRVLAFNSAGVRSEWSAPASARTKNAPVAPRRLLATTNAPKSVKLTWSANPESDIVKYVVEASGDGRKFKELTRTEGPSAEEGRLRDGVTRHYRIKAVDADRLESEWCDTVIGASKPLPDAPSDVEAEVLGGGGARVTWDAPPQPDVVRYNIWKKGLLGVATLGTSDKTSYLIDASTLGKGLSVVVTAVDDDGLESGRSAAVEIRAPRNR